MLAIHVGGPVERASKHKLPMDRKTLSLEGHDVECLGVNYRQRTLRCQGIDDCRQVLVSCGEPSHVLHLGDPDFS